MSDIPKIKTVDRPHTVSLITALENTIDDIAVGNMTAVEIIGCFHMVAANYMPKD